MRRALLPVFVIASVLLLAASPPAFDLSSWFNQATAYHTTTAFVPMAKPDYMGADSYAKMGCKVDRSQPLFNNFWQVRRIDSAHHIALAYMTGDSCGAALFVVPKLPPRGSDYGDIGVHVPDVDLSNFSTGRGLHIGSTYADVLAAYGGKKVQHGARFVIAYSATAHAHSPYQKGHPVVELPEQITIVIQNGRVSAIRFRIDEAALI